MANKSAKTTATRNAAALRRTHLTFLILHALFLLLRTRFFHLPFGTPSLLRYLAFNAPALAIELWFERVARPRYVSVPVPVGGGGERYQLRSAGEDLDAKGLTEWMWDVLFWTWGCVAVVAVLGDRGWWLWAAVPAYSAWLAYRLVGGMRQGAAGLAGAGMDAADGGSNRQRKMEKRGQGQKVYR
ncbi:MAG: hypothetical protein M1829_006764 [Trizodia sp. TS-e1964]|nr:MAG: hypothetical protein M1829_006764 [Trizodia sp. TS-e1964]